MAAPTTAKLVEVLREGQDMFVIRDGVKIAKRGQPGSKWAGQWISIEPGYLVIDSADGSETHIKYEGVTIH